MANKEILAALLAAALEGDDDEGGEGKQTVPPTQKQAEATAGLTAEQIEEAMDKRFKSLADSLADKQAKAGEGKTGEGKTSDEGDEGKTELTDTQIELIETKLESAFVSKGFDKETVSGLSGFLDYATMNDDEGKLSEEKITSLVEAISSVALREPPKGKRKNLPSSKSQGFHKYLDKDN